MADNQYGPLQPKQTTASDIRKVVANGTKTTGKGFTIANKEELEQKEASKQNGLPKSVKIGGNVGAKVGANVGLNTGKTIQQTTPVKKEKPQGPVAQPTITPQQITGDLFKNPIVQPINNIKVLHKDGEAVNANGSKMKVQPNQYNYNSSKLIKTDTERKKDLSAGIEALYADAYNKVTDGQQLTLEEVLGNENYKKQFDGVDEGRIQELINDANILAQYDDFDMQNLLSIYDKYKDFGLLLDVNKLSPKSKTAFISAIQGEGDNAIDKGVWQYMDIANVFSPLFWAEKAGEGFVNLTGLSKDKKTTKDLSQQIRERAANNKHDMLNEEEQNFAARDEIAKLDEKYKKYYTIDKDGNKKWNSMGKQNKYDEELMYIQNDVAKKHGDTLGAFWKNAFLNTIEVAATVHDMVANPGELLGGLTSTAVGTAENVASYGWDVYDWVKGNTMALHHKDVTQHLADLGGYDNYEEALQSAEYKLKDSPFKDLGMTILKQIQIDSSTAGLMGDYIAESYGSTDKFVESMGERPVETWSDIVSMLELGAFLSGKFGLISPMKSEALIDTLGNLDPFELGMKYGNKLNYGPVLKGETAALKLGGKTLKLPFKGVKNMGDMIVNKLSGLSEEERKFIRENPDDVDKFIKGEENSQSLIDRIVQKFDDLTSEKRKEGEEYENIRNSNVNVATKGLIDGIEEKLGTIGAKLTDNGIKLSKRFTPAIENKVKELYTYINDLRKKGNTATAEDLHWLRQQLDTVASWEKIPQGLEATFVNMVKDIRRLVDNSLKDQVPGMADIDANYRTILADIKALKQDWFNKDGTLKDSAYSKIRNLTNKGTNQPKLERLETLIPGITQDLKALAVSETVEKASKQMVGQYAQQIRGVGGGITAITSLLTGGFSIPSVVLGLLGMQFATPKNLVSLLKFGGRIDKKINGVLDKIKNGTKLTALETAELARYLNENREDLREKAEYMHEKGLLSDEEYKAIKKEASKEEYGRAQEKARNKAGDEELSMAKGDEEAVVNWVKNHSKNPGFVVRLLDETGMMKALTEAGEVAEKGTQGFTDIYNKYINLLEKPTDTTVQHEFFHAVFSVVDNKTKNYLLQEAKKILKENKMDNVAAEEWLAESFGIYAKRKMIDTGVIKAPRTFEQKLRNFFQKVYEWIQNFNGDRKTINKIFDEIYGGDTKLGKKGDLDLSYLLEGKEVKNQLGVGNGLRKKSVYHGSPADFDKFDSSHMGEGEGAQAHGWGHYVAVDKETAKRYANMRGNGEASYKGKTRQSIKDMAGLQTPEENMALGIMARMEEWGKTFEDARDSMIKDNEGYIKKLEQQIDKKDISWYGSLDYMKEKLKEAKDEIEILNRLDKKDFSKTKRNLYTNEIPDPVKANTPTGSNYLEEDGKLSESELNKFKEIFKDSGIKMLSEKFDDFGVKMMDYSGKNGRTLYRFLERALGSNKEASKFLESLGYDGIHYYGGRDGEAYVIFNDDALQIKDHIRYKKKIGDKDVEINKDITSPEQMAKVNSKGLSVIHDFISEKQAERALDVSKDILDENGNAYLWTHTNKYNDKMFANFESTRDSKYTTYSNADVAWFTNSLEMSKTYSANDSKLAPTKKFTNIDDFNKYAEKNKIDEGWKWDRYGDVKEINKTTIAENNGQYIPYTTRTFEYKFNNLFDAYETFNDKGLMEGRGIDRLIGEMPKTEEEAYSKFEKYIKGFENGKVTNKGNKLKDLEASLDVDNIIGYFDNKDAALAEAYAKSTPSDDYHYQGVAQNLKKPYVVDYSSNKKPQMWNKLGTLKDFAKKEGGKELSKIFDTMDKYQTEKWDILNFIDEGKKALLDKDNHYIDGNMIEDKDYFLGNIQQALRDGTVKLILDSPSWEGEEFAKIKNDIVANGKTFGDLHDMLKKMPGTDDVFYSDFKAMGDLPTVLKDFGVPEATRTLIMQKLVDREFYKSAGISYADRIRIHGLADLEKKLNGIELETNDYVRYALNDGNYDGVIFKNIIDYGGTPKEGWDNAKGGDVLTTFKSNQFKSWDNANPTDSKYISYKKKVSLDKKSEGLQKKNSSGLLAKGRDRMGDDGLRYKAAWHGSPAQFDRFDSSHMGEGEGAQAHGWGHYVALDKNTAKKYAEMMDEKYTTKKLGGLTAKQWSSKYHGGANDAETYAKWKIANGMQGNFWGTKSLEDAKKDAIFLEQQVLDEYKGWLEDYKAVDIDGEDYYQTPRGLYPAKNVRSEIKKLEDRIKAMQGITEKDLVIENKNIGNRNLYELDIPDPVKRDTPTGSNYFEEGEVISPKAGKKIADKLREEGHAPQDDIFGWSEGYLDRLLTSIEKGEKGKAVYEDIAVYLGGQKEASKFLESLGYDGIHYFGGRDGESYVLFNDNSPKIKNSIRYKKGLTAKDQTQTPEFKKWFEGSKVVDYKGEPLKVFHGSANKFTIFDSLEDGKNTGNKGLYGNGFYFTDSLTTAKEYGKMGVDLPFSDYGNIADWEKARMDKANVMEVYLDMKNPFYWKDIKNANQVRKLKEASGIRGLQWNDYLKEMRTLNDNQAVNFSKYLRNAGYDGIIYKGDNGTEYAVFKPSQIKSATDNIGTFDKNNPDIRYKKGYHGSKADFDRFDSSHMGEGEGNQAHGWGHYIAATKKTAKGYAQMGGNPRLSFKGLNRDELADRLIDAKLDGKEFPDGIANAIITRIEDDGLTFKEAKKEAINTFNNIAEEYKANGEMDKFNQTKKEIKTLEGLQRKEFEMKKGRNLYTVEIPDSKKANTPSGENYLNEEKVYGKKVYDKIFEEARKNKGWVNNKGAEWYIDDRLKFRGKDQMYGVWINKALEAGFGNDQKAVAKFLEGLGYEGIEYKGLQDGKAYVIFNDKNVDIKDHIRYKKGLTAKDQTQTPEFKKWFEGSKVVNEDGNPLAVYHGTKNGGFTEFNMDDDSWGNNVGARFSADIDVADSYASDEYSWSRAPIIKGDNYVGKKTYGEGDNFIYKAYLDIKKPLVLDYEGYGALNHPRLNAPGDYMREILKSDEYDGIIAKNIRDEGGFDGGINDPEERYAENTIYGVKKPTQIKSATDNIGTFDKDNPDIRYKKGLEKKSDGLEKKRTTTLGKHSKEINRIASQLGVKGDNDMQKIKSMNKEIKDPKYQGTKIKKELYNLKWQIKKDYIIDHNKKIVDKGPKNTTVRVVQNGVQATWHFNQKQYKELKKMGVLIKNKKKRE